MQQLEGVVIMFKYIAAVTIVCVVTFCIYWIKRTFWPGSPKDDSKDDSGDSSGSDKKKKAVPKRGPIAIWKSLSKKTRKRLIVGSSILQVVTLRLQRRIFPQQSLR